MRQTKTSHLGNTCQYRNISQKPSQPCSSAFFSFHLCDVSARWPVLALNRWWVVVVSRGSWKILLLIGAVSVSGWEGDEGKRTWGWTSFFPILEENRIWQEKCYRPSRLCTAVWCKCASLCRTVHLQTPTGMVSVCGFSSVFMAHDLPQIDWLEIYHKVWMFF